MTPDQEEQLRSVNAEVNAIPYSEVPQAGEGADVWKDTPDGGTWVCRDYVLLKSERLQALGWNTAAMSVVLCWTETNEYHAVLAVDDGESSPWILDSRFPLPYRMNAVPAAYRWDRRQIAGTSDFEAIS